MGIGKCPTAGPPAGGYDDGWPAPPTTPMPRLRQHLSRFARPAVAAVLVLAQAVAACGFPVVQTARHALAGCPGGRCGCDACGRTEGCCCAGTAPRAAKPTGCCVVPAGDEPAVRWVPGVQARHCRGDGPLGLSAEVPAVPPSCAASPVPAPPATGSAPPADLGGPTHVTPPPDPPPKPPSRG